MIIYDAGVSGKSYNLQLNSDSFPNLEVHICVAPVPEEIQSFQ